MNAVGSSVATAPRARHRRGRPVAPLRGSPRVGARTKPATSSSRATRAPSATTTSVGELGEVLLGRGVRAARPRATSRSSSRSASRSRTSPRRSTSTAKARGAGIGHGSWSSAEGATTPIEPVGLEEIRAARARIAGVGRCARRCPPRPRGRRPRDLAQAREPPADRLVQAARRRQRDGAGRPGGARARRLHRERRQHGAGRRLVRAAARHPLHGRRARPRAREPSSTRSSGSAAGSSRSRSSAGGRCSSSTTIPGMEGCFVHPVSDPAVIAGNGTIGLEILEDLPDVDAVLVPYGGGGLSCGIASAMRALRPRARVFACEVETAAPLAASLAAGRPAGRRLHAELRRRHRRPQRARRDVAARLDAARRLARRLARRGRGRDPPPRRAGPRGGGGAAGAAVAAAASDRAPAGKIVCVVSGGNIDPARSGLDPRRDESLVAQRNRQPPRKTKEFRP